MYFIIFFFWNQRLHLKLWWAVGTSPTIYASSLRSELMPYLPSSSHLAPGLCLTLSQLFTHSFAYTEFSGPTLCESYFPSLPRTQSIDRKETNIKVIIKLLVKSQGSILYWVIQEMERECAAHGKGEHGVWGALVYEVPGEVRIKGKQAYRRHAEGGRGRGVAGKVLRLRGPPDRDSKAENNCAWCMKEV